MSHNDFRKNETAPLPRVRFSKRIVSRLRTLAIVVSIASLRNSTSGFEQLTEDHHPDHSLEYARLAPLWHDTKTNPTSRFYFVPSGPVTSARIMTELKTASGQRYLRGTAVSRSFGDPEMRPCVISEPDVKTIPFDPSTRHIFALCSDGGIPSVEQAFLAARDQSNISLDDLFMRVRLHTSPQPEDDVTVALIELLPEN